jgi:hypothetical protein
MGRTNRMIAIQPEHGSSTTSESPIGDLPPTVRPVDSIGGVELVRSSDTTERCAWSLVWLGVIIGGLNIWGSWSSWPLGGIVAPMLLLAGIAGLAASWVVRSPRSRTMQLLGLGSVIVAAGIPEAVNVHLRQYYSTDSAAFNQVAARVLFHGHNPYTTTMASAARLLQVPAHNWTYTVNGGHVTSLSYPAGSFLFQVPAMALGFHHQIVDWMDLYAWLITGVLLFLLIQASVRWLAALLILTPIFVQMFSAGGTDAAFVPFLILAVWRWDRFHLGRSAGVASWIGPIALGLACSIKQTPWFCLPFLVVGLFIEARNTGRRPVQLVMRYLAIVVAVFFVVNIPFIVWQPTAWARGTFLPFTDPLVADGQGLVTLVLHGVARGASLPMLTVAGVLVFVALMAAFVVWYPQMKRIWMILLPLTLFVATRSLTSYLLDLYPAAIVAALSVAPGVRPALVRTSKRFRTLLGLAALAPAMAAVAVSALAFVSPPLVLAVRSVTTSDAATSLDSVTVAVGNSTGHTVTPHFMVTIGSGHPDGFWFLAHRRQVVLRPHMSVIVTLYPTLYTGAPAHGSYWLVEAYTSSPEGLSTSNIQLWRLGKAQ